MGRVCAVFWPGGIVFGGGVSYPDVVGAGGAFSWLEGVLFWRGGWGGFGGGGVVGLWVGCFWGGGFFCVVGFVFSFLYFFFWCRLVCFVGFALLFCVFSVVWGGGLPFFVVDTF